MLELSVQDSHGLSKICHALSTELRVNILKQLQNGTMSCLELSKILGYPLSTISVNVKILEEAGLIITQLQPARNGSKKLCSLVYHGIFIKLDTDKEIITDEKKYEMDIPIGNYMNCEVKPSCGYVGEEVDTLIFDQPYTFFDPKRINARLLWFRKGFVEYKIPVKDPKLLEHITAVSFQVEMCSEAPGYNHKWKSDITLWINDIEIGTWTSPSDFGDRKGRFTPEYWELGNTQYGILTTWKVDREKSSINDELLSNICLADLDLSEKDYITLRIGIKEDANHIGGINIFGEKFGDYDQGIKMTFYY